MRRSRFASWVCVAMAFAGAGCVGARFDVTANRALYPLSLSNGVRDASGRLLRRHALEKVGSLHVEAKRLGFFYSAYTPNPVADISSEVNEQVRAASGEAVVDLRFSVPEACDLSMVMLFNILPFWPGCARVAVTGDIVRRRPSYASPQPVVPAPPLEPVPSLEAPTSSAFDRN